MPKITIEIKIDPELKEKLGIIPVSIEMEEGKDSDEQIKELYLGVLRAVREVHDKTLNV
jgi:hypothetical protein